MLRLWQSITSVGTTHRTEETAAKYIRLTNTICLLAFISLVMQIPIFILFWPATDELLYLLLAWIFFFPGVFILNYFQHHRAAKIYLCTLPSLFMTAFGLLLSSDGNVHYLQIFIVTAALTIFLDSEKVAMWVCVATAVVSFAFIESYGLFFPPIVELPQSFISGNRLLILITLIGTITAFLFFIQRILRTAERNLAEEKQKSDTLLLSILPQKIAHELKEQGVAQPVSIQSASVLFTDFTGFTAIAAQMQPVQLVSELDTCFRKFDEIIGEHGLEKLKTIGDAYMAAGGLPEPSPGHIASSVAAALRINEVIKTLFAQRQSAGRPYWQVRIGVHAGPVVAGVIGRQKFQYDVWGDTVNTAARLESSSEPGRVNISRLVYERVREFFNCSARGILPVKNKEPMEMFFVDGLKESYCSPTQPFVPNSHFFQAIKNH